MKIGLVVNEIGWQKLLKLKDYKGMLGNDMNTLAYQWGGIPVYKRIMQKDTNLYVGSR